MSQRGRKKAAAARAKAGRSPGPDEQSRPLAGEVAAAAPPVEQQKTVESAPQGGGQETVLQQLFNGAGRIFHSMTKWLEHDKWYVKVLGVITWLTLLGVLVIMVMKWDTWFTVAAVGAFTGVSYVGSKIGSGGGSGG
ncbi:hypothetical protein [Actinophytocola glycyrrhizae]|uniref:DUF3040 family protein n=1 Tax=Actinophytocola glycyrrhizae TaxID=2044873 RepID=A0ABV9SFH2_9PSEU